MYHQNYTLHYKLILIASMVERKLWCLVVTRDSVQGRVPFLKQWSIVKVRFTIIIQGIFQSVKGVKKKEY